MVVSRKGKKTNKTSIGSALIKSKALLASAQRKTDGHSSAGVHVSSTDGGDAGLALASYLEGTSLDDFLASAVMSNRQFVAEKENAVVLNDGLVDQTSSKAMEKLPTMDFRELTVPRRPVWDASTTPQELNTREKEAFLEWRREIALVEERMQDMSVTPFEKNLEVWRQLWRVIERSDMVIQILDARNPLFYRSKDLEKYITEVDAKKQLLLVVNKSDFLTTEQRLLWARYFRSQGVRFVFFSAKLSQIKLDEEYKALHMTKIIEDDSENEEETDEEETDEEETVEEETVDEDVKSDINDMEEKQETLVEKEIKIPTDFSDDSMVLSREQLLEFLSLEADKISALLGKSEEKRITVGMTGFPNVGKSSVINALLGASTHMHSKQRVAVGATPGKTKHFQTMILSEKLMLCDCPGLVFPSFVSSKAEMICCGVLSLSQLRDHRSPSSLVCQRIPKIILEKTYKIRIAVPKTYVAGDPVDAYAFLEAYAQARGFMTSTVGTPDTSRAARIVLTDYVNGKLLYCHPCPDLSEEEKNAFDPFESAKEIFGEDELKELSNANSTSAMLLPSSSIGDYQLTDEPNREKTTVSKRLKKHGRKGRKGRDKNPYEDGSMFDTTSSGLAFMSGGKKNKKKEFTRATMPHHPTYEAGTKYN